MNATVDFIQVADVVGEEIATAGYVTNACILAARMTSIVLRELQVTGVETMACELKVYSPAYVAMRTTFNAIGRDPTEAEVDEWMQKGAWSVELSFAHPAPNQPNHRGIKGYNAHVVTLVDRQWLIDPTLAQVNRPAKDLIVEPPFAWPINYADTRDLGLVTEAANGTTSLHRLLPGRKDFTRAPDWKMAGQDDATILRILNRLEA